MSNAETVTDQARSSDFFSGSLAERDPLIQSRAL